MNMKKLVCNVCEFEFTPNKEDHYIARANGKEGAFISLSTRDEGNIYDAFDCPVCGCQKLVQHRLRATDYYAYEEENEDSEDSSEEHTD